MSLEQFKAMIKLDRSNELHPSKKKEQQKAEQKKYETSLRPIEEENKNEMTKRMTEDPSLTVKSIERNKDMKPTTPEK